MSTKLKRPTTLDELTEFDWPRTVSFANRLAGLTRIIQEKIDGLPNPRPDIPRVRATTKISLDELALVLPPRERKALEYLRARKSLTKLLGQQGFRNDRSLCKTTQKLVSRVQHYCGASTRCRLLQHIDRPGKYHRRRRGRPRAILPASRFPPLHLWVPSQFVSAPPRGLKIIDTPGSLLRAA